MLRIVTRRSKPLDDGRRFGTSARVKPQGKLEHLADARRRTRGAALRHVASARWGQIRQRADVGEGENLLAIGPEVDEA
jgi:hypothetical protein